MKCGRREHITRDKKGFNDFDILVMTPAEFVNKAKEYFNIVYFKKYNMPMSR